MHDMIYATEFCSLGAVVKVTELFITESTRKMLIILTHTKIILLIALDVKQFSFQQFIR